MGRVTNRAKFRDDARRGFQKGAKFSDWKDKGETRGHIHPTIGLFERFNHGMIPSIEEDRDHKEEFRKRRYNCVGEVREEVPNDGCPICVLQEFAKEKIEKGADKRELILEGGSGRDRLSMELQDLSGDAGYWTNPRAKQEVAFIWIPEAKERKTAKSTKDAVEIITGPQSLGERIIEVIDSQVDNRGSLRGDPTLPSLGDYDLRLRKGRMVLVDRKEEKGAEEPEFNPFPFKLMFDEKKDPKLMYDAEKLDHDLCPIDEEVIQIMLADEEELGTDFEKMCAPGDEDRMLAAIRSTWVSRAIPFEEFEDYFIKRSGGKPAPARGREERAPARGRDDRDRDRDRDERGRDRDRDRPADSPPAATFCQNCGTKVDGAKFCGGCGAPQTSEKESEPERKANPPEQESKADPEPEPERRDEGEKKEGAADGSGNTIGKIKCEGCDEEVELLMPSCRCALCGHQHTKLKAKVDAGDVPY